MNSFGMISEFRSRACLNAFQTYIPTTEEVVQFLKDIEGTRTELFVAFSVFLGLRRSETFGLKWKDIDFDKKIVR